MKKRDKYYYYEYILFVNNLRDGFKQVAKSKFLFNIKYLYNVYKNYYNYYGLEIRKQRVYY